MPLCGCGCGTRVARRFVRGHVARTARGKAAIRSALAVYTPEQIRTAKRMLASGEPTGTVAAFLGVHPNNLQGTLHPERNAARSAVAEAIKAGRLVRPPACSSCDRVGRVEAHHDDYAAPLAVRWLCPSCHKLHHHREAA